MAVPYHTHSFEIPSATKAEVEAGVRTDVAATPASLGSAASKDVSYFATASQGNNADTAVQPTLVLTAGDGLTGGGTLAANRTFALSSTSLASLALADTAVQTINGKSGRTITLSSDDVSAVPIAREAEIIANTAARHTHSNKVVLDATTAAFTTAMSSKLAGIPADADKTPGVATVTSNGLMSSGDKTKLDGIAAGATANTGTVTSVAVTVPAGLAVAGAPITTAGSFAISYAAGYRGYTTAEANKLAGIPADADKTPALAAVATSGNYADLNGKPTLGSLAAKNNIAVADISATGDPSAATFLRGDGTWGTVAGAGTVTSVGLSAPTGFAVSGSPVTGSGTLTISYASGYQGYTTAEANKLAGIPADADKTPALAAVATTGSYGDLSGKPATFPPSVHTHSPSEVGLGNVANKTEAQMVASGAIADALGGKQPALGFTPVQQGTGTGQVSSQNVKIGWGQTGGLLLHVDATDFGNTWPINIQGAATSLGGVWTPNYITDQLNWRLTDTRFNGYIEHNFQVPETGNFPNQVPGANGYIVTGIWMWGPGRNIGVSFRQPQVHLINSGGWRPLGTW